MPEWTAVRVLRARLVLREDLLAATKRQRRQRWINGGVGDPSKISKRFEQESMARDSRRGNRDSTLETLMEGSR
jgi:hypothetical protein